LSPTSRAEAPLILMQLLASMLVLFLVVPIVSLFVKVDPNVAREIFSEETLARQVRSAFTVSLVASAIAVALLALTGVPLAYVLARYDFRGKSIVESIIDIPLVMPHAVAGIMILAAYSRRGLLGGLTQALGVRVQDSLLGIVMAMMFVSAPLLVDTVKAGIASIDPLLEAVARTLGASRFQAIVDVVLPLAWRHILAGVILAWARALSEVGAILIVAYYPTTINILIIQYMNIYGLPYAIVVSAVFAAFAASLFTAIRGLLRR
jgi:molybdate/tungstate transport system permease protein